MLGPLTGGLTFPSCSLEGDQCCKEDKPLLTQSPWDSEHQSGAGKYQVAGVTGGPAVDSGRIHTDHASPLVSHTLACWEEKQKDNHISSFLSSYPYASSYLFFF